MSLNGPVVVDSVKLSADGTFAFDEKAPAAPEFYRLRIAGQIINIAIDSTETVNIKAEYPGMASQYEVSGSEDCSRIKELTLMQMGLQTQLNAIAQNPQLNTAAVNDSVMRVIEAYKKRSSLIDKFLLLYLGISEGSCERKNGSGDDSHRGQQCGESCREHWNELQHPGHVPAI